MESLIYRDFDLETATKAGYFEPKNDYHRLAPGFWARHLYDADDQIIYFPGSFGQFHAGHLDVCKRAKEKHPGAILVIAPSNSDYLSQKYGKWSVNASNLHRYNNIQRALLESNLCAYIDMDPMLNMTCDQNFTDLLQGWLNEGAGDCRLSNMSHKPIILAGKDRPEFLKLNDLQDLVTVEYYEDRTGASTSSLENKMRQKKKLILRCMTKEEYQLFVEYFHDQYLDIAPLYLDIELGWAEKMAKEVKATHTICKEYAGFLPYIKVSRQFKHPLSDSFFIPVTIPEGAIILDSDVYSGGTRNFMEFNGAKFHALLNAEEFQDELEILDISDFRDPTYAYPFVDISSRCSMQAFDHEFHSHFNQFKSALENLS